MGSNAKYGTEYSTPVMFQVDKIKVKQRHSTRHHKVHPGELQVLGKQGIVLHLTRTQLPSWQALFVCVDLQAPRSLSVHISDGVDICQRSKVPDLLGWYLHPEWGRQRLLVCCEHAEGLSYVCWGACPGGVTLAAIIRARWSHPDRNQEQGKKHTAVYIAAQLRPAGI